MLSLLCENAIELRSILQKTNRGRVGFYPCVLESDFPHVLKRLVALWGTKEASSFFESLLAPPSLYNKGFPADALSEIQELRLIHDEVLPQAVSVAQTHDILIDRVAANRAGL